jgi:hypothetical protein
VKSLEARDWLAFQSAEYRDVRRSLLSCAESSRDLLLENDSLDSNSTLTHSVRAAHAWPPPKKTSLPELAGKGGNAVPGLITVAGNAIVLLGYLLALGNRLL